MNLLDPNIKKDIDVNRAKVIAALGGNVYKVRDVNTGKTYNVYSSSQRKRNDMVKVSKGTIVGKSRVVTKMKIVSI